MLTTRWADDLVKRADELDPHERDKAQFYLRQVTAALSPSNFVATNPELLRMTLQESGENLVRGLKMMAEDIEAGKGNLRIRQSDARAFKLGVNLASDARQGGLPQRPHRAHPVRADDAGGLQAPAPDRAAVDQQVLHPRPQSGEVVHPLGGGSRVDRVRHLLGQSGRAPRRQGFDAYMREGILAALDASNRRPASARSLRSAIASAARCSRRRSATWRRSATSASRSATFFTTQVDFTDAGDLKVFVDAEQLKEVEEKMAEHGYLEGSPMANAFNMLRPNDLIWSYYVNNYLKGKEPMPFDLAGLELRTRPACPPPTTTSTYATAIFRTISPTGAWFWAARHSTSGK